MVNVFFCTKILWKSAYERKKVPDNISKKIRFRGTNNAHGKNTSGRRAMTLQVGKKSRLYRWNMCLVGNHFWKNPPQSWFLKIFIRTPNLSKFLNPQEICQVIFIMGRFKNHVPKISEIRQKHVKKTFFKT